MSETPDNSALSQKVKDIYDNNLAMRTTLAKHLVKSNDRLDKLESLTSSLTQIEAQVEHFRQDRARLVCREAKGEISAQKYTVFYRAYFCQFLCR